MDFWAAKGARRYPVLFHQARDARWSAIQALGPYFEDLVFVGGWAHCAQGGEDRLRSGGAPDA